MARAFEPYRLDCEFCMFFTSVPRNGDIMGHCSYFGLKSKKFDGDAPECDFWTGLSNVIDMEEE